MTYISDLLDSLRWDFGDGTFELQTSNIGTGSANHTYANPGTYTVTLEQWGVENFPDNTTPFHCTYAHENVIYDQFTDSMCGGEFLMHTSGNTVTFSNTSVIHAPSFSSHSTESLWDFGNGMHGMYLNRLYDVSYAPGTYTACLYYAGFSFNNNGYLYDCATCQTFTIGNTTGIEEGQATGLQLFPNPTNGDLHLAGIPADQLTDLRMYDLLGHMYAIDWQQQSDGSVVLATEKLSKGMYMLHCQAAGAERKIAFVKL